MTAASDRYRAAIHRLQTCIRFSMSMRGYDSLPGQVVPDDHECSPKHQRVGVESAMSLAEALGELLVEKGIVTRDELVEAIVHAAESRADSHEVQLRDRYPNVRFH